MAAIKLATPAIKSRWPPAVLAASPPHPMRRADCFRDGSVIHVENPQSTLSSRSIILAGLPKSRRSMLKLRR